ncbi:MAG: glucose 1-dehydrogenase [Phycisphaerae bacterium]|nr:glucose 1-dehydrogenase [Phycisphaerae bacterium]
MSDMRMRDKRVLVVGSGTGIGRGIADRFVREGAEVVYHYGRSADGAKASVETARQAGRRAEAFQADLRDAQQAKDLAARALDFLGGMDVLVYNAGITMNRPFENVTVEQFDALYAVNVRSPFFVTQAVVPTMIAQGTGSIINITSIHALAGLQEHSVYAGTRGAIVSYTRSLAMELAPKGVRVNAVAPGSIAVENYAVVVPDFDPKAAGKNIPVGRIGSPADIAGAVVFLASDEAKFIVGQTLVVDGGTTSFMAIGLGVGEPMNAEFGKGYVPGV